MERRNFLGSVVSLPAISVPSLGIGKNEFYSDARTPDEEEYWEIESSWKGDWGELVLVKNGEREHEFRYETYTEWEKVTLLNAQFVNDQAESSTNYVADIFDLNIHSLYIDPPYFHSVFRGEQGEVRVRQGKYSDTDYRYYIRTAEKEREYGSNDFENMITDIRRKLSDDG